jgi:hypothetical protein
VRRERTVVKDGAPRATVVQQVRNGAKPRGLVAAFAEDCSQLALATITSTTLPKESTW